MPQSRHDTRSTGFLERIPRLEMRSSDGQPAPVLPPRACDHPPAKGRETPDGSCQETRKFLARKYGKASRSLAPSWRQQWASPDPRH